MRDKTYPCSNGTLLNNNNEDGESNGLPVGVSGTAGHLQDGSDCLQQTDHFTHAVNGSAVGQCLNGQAFVQTILPHCRSNQQILSNVTADIRANKEIFGLVGEPLDVGEGHKGIEEAFSEGGGVVEIMAPPHIDEGAYRRTVFDSQSRDLHFFSSPPVVDEPEEVGAELDSEEAEREHANHIPTRLQILIDPANLCTFSGALLAVLAMASMWTGRYYLGMFFNVVANIADIVDGPVARSMPHRHPAFSQVGSKLDCYADLVSHFVVPASLLMHLGHLGLFPVLLAGIYVCSGIMRQSYFEVTGRCDGGTCIFGLTSDYMVGIYTLTMHVRPLIGGNESLMLIALAITILVMIYCSLTLSLRSRRYAGVDLLFVTVYNVILCISCGFLALFSDNDYALSVIASFFLPVLSILAYPLYFRHVEINR